MSADELFSFTHLLMCGESEGPTCTSCRPHQRIRDLVSAYVAAAHMCRVLEEMIRALFCFTAGLALTSPWTPSRWNKCVWKQPALEYRDVRKTIQDDPDSSCCLVCEQPIKPLERVRFFWLSVWFPALAEVMRSRSTNSCRQVKFYCF